MKAKLNIRKINRNDALKMLLFDAWWRPLQQLHCFKKKKKPKPKKLGCPGAERAGLRPQSIPLVPQPLCCVWGVNSAHTLHLFCPHPSAVLLMMNPD